MIRLKYFFTKSVLRAETIKTQDVVNDANNETETLGLKFTPNYMPYEEKNRITKLDWRNLLKTVNLTVWIK